MRRRRLRAGSDALGGDFRASVKRTFLRLSKLIGLFHLSRYFTRDKLRIIGYHGFSITDEGEFRKQLFMDPVAFEKRMRFLSEKRVPVLKLDHALECLDSGTLQPCSTVITIDDGFYSVYKHAFPILREFAFPFTVYVSTYYSVKKNPVFRLVVQYIFWKTEEDRVDVTGMGTSRDGEISLSNSAETEKVMWEIIEYGETQLEEDDRCRLCKKLGELLGVDYDLIVKNRGLSFMTSTEIRELSENGVDIQIHSHKHRMPVDETLLKKEIEKNREILEDWVGKPLLHACYPDGLWNGRQFPWLEALGVRSACTCDSGLNDRDTPKLALKRALDSEDRSQIEFEAELSGYTEFLRSARACVRRLGRC